MPTVTESQPAAIIDADSHITEPADIWTSRLPSKYLEVAPRVEFNSSTGHHHWRIGERWLCAVGQLTQAGWPEYPPSSPLEYEECDPAAYNSADRLSRLDQYGVDIQILYPNLVGFYASDIVRLGPELGLLCVRAYNDFLVDWCAADRSRLIPVAALPFWDLDASLGEMRRCADLGFTSILFANKLEQIDLPSFVDTHWDPLYAAAQEMEMPVNFHIGFAESELAQNFSLERFERRRTMQDESRLAAVRRAGRNLMSQCDVLGSLLVSGLCERFPRVKLVSVETGFGHIPFYLETLDWQWKSQGNDSLPLLPSEYFARQCYCTFWFDQVALPLLAHYPENFMFSTDFPHPIGLSPGPCAGTDLMPSEWVRRAFSTVDKSLADNATYWNAARLYRCGQAAAPGSGSAS
jgi:predicted TIM-barrel fold metal-dependent hydrolase